MGKRDRGKNYVKTSIFAVESRSKLGIFCGSKGSSSAEGSELYMIDPMQSTIATLAVWVAVWEFFQH